MGHSACPLAIFSPNVGPVELRQGISVYNVTIHNTVKKNAAPIIKIPDALCRQLSKLLLTDSTPVPKTDAPHGFSP